MNTIMKEGRVLNSEALNAQFIVSENNRRTTELQRIQDEQNRITNENERIEHENQRIIDFQEKMNSLEGTDTTQFHRRIQTVESDLRQVAINVKTYGATGDGVTDDYPAIKLAIDELHLKGGTLYFPKGKYAISEQLNFTRSCTVVGERDSSNIFPIASMNSLIHITSKLVKIDGLNIDNRNGLSTNGITVNKLGDNIPVEITNMYIVGFTNGVMWLGGDRMLLNNSTFVNNTVGVRVENDGRNSVIDNIYTLGGNGIYFKHTAIRVEGTVIRNCYIFTGFVDYTTYSIKIVNPLAVTIENCIIDQIVRGEGIIIEGVYTKDVHIRGCWIGANFDTTTATNGIYISHGKGIHINECTIVGFANCGIWVFGATTRETENIFITQCNFLDGDPSLKDIQLDYAKNVLIEKCVFNGTASIIEVDDCTGLVRDCSFNVLPNRINLSYKNQLKGMKMNNQGLNTFDIGNRTKTIEHGLSYRPLASDISVTLTSFPANNESIGQIVVDNINDYTFRVICQSPPITANVNFSWRVDITN